MMDDAPYASFVEQPGSAARAVQMPHTCKVDASFR
jgi:hypothetical protein